MPCNNAGHFMSLCLLVQSWCTGFLIKWIHGRLVVHLQCRAVSALASVLSMSAMSRASHGRRPCVHRELDAERFRSGIWCRCSSSPAPACILDTVVKKKPSRDTSTHGPHPTGSNRPYVRTPSSPIRSLRSAMGVDQGQGKAVSQVG
jgi:hypothetical protein